MKDMRSLISSMLPEKIKKILTERRLIRETEIWRNAHRVKQNAIISYQTALKIDTLVETGTYTGEMVWAQLNTFKKIYSIELGEDLWKAAVKRFKDYSHVTILQGDSGKVLNDVISKLSTPAIFWLDGHYSAGITAKGDLECPIYEELKAIFKSDLNHFLLIDDARCFNGIGDYPSIAELSKFILSNRSQSKIEVRDDIIRVELKDAS